MNTYFARLLSRIVLYLAAILSTPLGAALAQQPSIRPYQTEEDLWEALGDGEITFDEFLELLDLARTGADSLILQPSDWEALPGSGAGYLVPPDTAQRLAEEVHPDLDRPRHLPFSWTARSGIDAELDEPTSSDGYSVVRIESERFNALFDWTHDHESGGEWRRRTLVYHDRNISAQLGTIEPRWGRGLVVGRRSRVLTTSDLEGSLAQPSRGRFNGIWVSSNERRRVSLHALYSVAQSDSLTDESVGAGVVFNEGHAQVGVSGLAGRIDGRNSSARYKEQIVGTHMRFSTSGHSLLAEIAMNDDGASAKAIELLWPLAHGRFQARAWSYGTDFINPWGGGPGHSDTRMIQLTEIDDSYASRTTGERGFDFITRLTVSPHVNLRWDWMSHREEPDARLEHSGVFRAEFQRQAWRTTPFVRARIDEDQTESFSLGNYLWVGSKDRELNLRFEVGTHTDDEVQFIRTGLGAKVQLNRIVHFAPAVRWNDPNLDEPADGYWYFYFTEAIVPYGQSRIEVALVWKKYETSDEDDQIELRVRSVLK